MGKRNDKLTGSIATIRNALLQVPSGSIFKSESALIHFLAERTRIHRTTIKRNRNYYELVRGHLERQPGAVGFLSIEEAGTATLKAKLAVLEAKNVQLEKEIKRLKAALNRIAGKPDALELPPMHRLTNKNAEPAEVAPAANTNPDSVAFTNTAIALHLVLAWIAEVGLEFTADRKLKQFEDPTRVGKLKIVVPTSRARYYFELSNKNPETFPDSSR